MSAVITINQCLHGYKEGHQLLASSRDLTTVEKKILLFQTDLSGSYVDEGFDSYITGYPIPIESIYVFSKTWYAKEMKRPGCVWTHTLLINFSDIGKIPELSILTKLFKRPTSNESGSYNEAMNIDLAPLLKIVENASDEIVTDKLCFLNALYENPESTIIVTSESSIRYEEAILKLWSDQWPRLRRNFMFCTGALGLKKLDQKEFDFQIIPNQNILTVSRQSKRPYLVNIDDNHFKSKWINILTKSPKQSIRKFLWTYGTDIDGERDKYIPLLLVYEILYKSKSEINLKELCHILNEHFTSIEDAKFLKKSLFKAGGLLLSIENKLVEFLITSNEIQFIGIDELQLEDRLFELITKVDITFADFLRIIKNAKPNIISNKIWNKLPLKNIDYVALLKEQADFVSILVKMYPEFAMNSEIWKLDYKIQVKICHELFESGKIKNWTPYLSSVLEAGSDIIFEFRKSIGQDVVIQSLDWLNEKGNADTLNAEWEKHIFQKEKCLLTWLSEFDKNLSSRIIILIFSYYNSTDIQRLNVSISSWVKGYENLKKSSIDDSFVVYVACSMLSIGLTKKHLQSYLLIEVTFHDVYIYASSFKIKENIWKIIPKEIEEEESKYFLLFSYKGTNAKKKSNKIASWDYKKLLIATLCRSYIKNSWPLQSFLKTLDIQEEFSEAVKYCLSFGKGVKFFNQLSYEIRRGKIRANTYQHILIETYYKNK
jgi:hypothetical protein